MLAHLARAEPLSSSAAPQPTPARLELPTKQPQARPTSNVSAWYMNQPRTRHPTLQAHASTICPGSTLRSIALAPRERDQPCTRRVRGAPMKAVRAQTRRRALPAARRPPPTPMRTQAASSRRPGSAPYAARARAAATRAVTPSPRSRAALAPSFVTHLSEERGGPHTRARSHATTAAGPGAVATLASDASAGVGARLLVSQWPP